jgi:hypothetical protein
MSLPRFNENVENISELADRPNDTNGLTAAELKARFDKAGKDIVSFINNTLIPYLEGTSAAAEVGISPIVGLESTNVQAALEELKVRIDDVETIARGNRRSPAFSVVGGTYAYKEQADGDTNNWELALLSGTRAKINFARTTGPIDVFMIGGGHPGYRGSFKDNVAIGGKGGQGGRRVTRRNIEIEEGVDYSFTVGGSDVSTFIFGQNTMDGQYTSGGPGASVEIAAEPTTTRAEEGSNGEYAFGAETSLLFSGRRYGAGGGGGGVGVSETVSYEIPGGRSDQMEMSVRLPGQGGGVTGGGSGGNDIAGTSGTGANNTGAGGGGAFLGTDHGLIFHQSAGYGGSGIIIIRNARG